MTRRWKSEARRRIDAQIWMFTVPFAFCVALLWVPRIPVESIICFTIGAVLSIASVIILLVQRSKVR